jgi:glycosyltransferase involved in cell wall biosynthesis
MDNTLSADHLLSVPGPRSPVGVRLGEASLALTVIVPIFNEAESVPMLVARLTESLAAAPSPYAGSYEIILVDDGSTDATFGVCADLQRRDARLRVVQFRRNYGKTAALNAGFALCQGRYVVTIDADMQEDPTDMFRLLEQLDAGYDLVSGWRQHRDDPVSKRLPSWVYNTVVAAMTGIRLHDFNCGFKAYRREVVGELRLYGDMHRFVPVLAHQSGFRVTEVPVQHQRRQFGQSKYGSGRLARGYLDFVQVLFLTGYAQQPFRLFGTVGTFCCLVGGVALVYLTALWFLGLGPIGNRPLLTMGALLVMTGVQLLSLGLIGELLRSLTYRPGEGYAIRQILEGEQREE